MSQDNMADVLFSWQVSMWELLQSCLQDRHIDCRW